METTSQFLKTTGFLAYQASKKKDNEIEVVRTMKLLSTEKLDLGELFKTLELEHLPTQSDHDYDHSGIQLINLPKTRPLHQSSAQYLRTFHHRDASDPRSSINITSGHRVITQVSNHIDDEFRKLNGSINNTLLTEEPASPPKFGITIPSFPRSMIKSSHGNKRSI
jgi:hypothetical protein